MMHPSTEPRWVSEGIGLGVFATSFIPKGTVVYAIDPLEVIVTKQSSLLNHSMLASKIDRYAYVDPMGRHIISWDHAKYVNHSCQPNTISTGYGFEIAIKDIDKDEQITDEYALFNLNSPMSCACGAEKCRGLVSSTDDKEQTKLWDETIKQALDKLHTVEQPLFELLSDKTKVQLNKYIESGKSYKSVRSLMKKPVETCIVANVLN